MAQKLENFDFGARDRYPWNEWFDGNTWEITKDDVANGNLSRFAGTARTQAKQRDKKLRTRSTPNGTLVIQAYEAE
jgi:hypothetical protein